MMRKRSFRVVTAGAVTAGLLALGANAVAQTPHPAWPGSLQGVGALRLPAVGVVVDGRLAEPAWAQAPVHDTFVQMQPTDGRAAPASLRTTVQILADEEALVIGIRAFDDRPELIRAPLGRRDEVRRDQDFVAVFLDTVGLKRSAQYVRVGAGGSVADGVITAATNNEDRSPDFDLEVAAQRLPDGYSVEIRWPLSALRFSPDSSLPWRLMVERGVPREQAYVLNSTPLRQNALSRLDAMLPIDGLGELMQQAAHRSFLTLKPELTLRRVTGLEPGQAVPSTTHAGLELKWRPRADWVIDATLRPDYAQVDLDNPPLAGNTRYAQYLPEKRGFFLESLDVMGLSAQGGDPMAAAFHSRTLANPDWGLRATWRGEASDATVLQARDLGGGTSSRGTPWATQTYDDAEPAEVQFVRARKGMDGWSAALLATQRQRASGRDTQVVGGEINARLSSETRWRAAWAGSSSTADFDAQGEPVRRAAQTGHWLWLNAARQWGDWRLNASVQETTPRFTNDNGFVPQRGVRSVSGGISNRLSPSDSPWLPDWMNQLQPSLGMSQTRTLADARNAQPGGELVQQNLGPGFWFTGPRNLDIWGNLGWAQQRTQPGLPLHTLQNASLGGHLNPNAWFTRIEGNWTLGQLLDVDANRVGNGFQGGLDALFRAPLNQGQWWLEFNPNFNALRLNTSGPAWAHTLQEWQLQQRWYLHFSPRTQLRLTLLQRRFSRLGDAQPIDTPAGGFLQPTASRANQWSLLAQQRMEGGHVLSAGATGSRSTDQGPVQEWFLKYTHLFIQ
jgi:hypothetical protein